VGKAGAEGVQGARVDGAAQNCGTLVFPLDLKANSAAQEPVL